MSPIPKLPKFFRGYPLYWICQFLGWSGVFITHLLGFVFDPQRRPLGLGEFTLFLMGLFIFSHFYRSYIHHFGWLRLEWKKLVPRVLAAAFCIGLANSLLCRMVTGFEPHFLIEDSALFLIPPIWVELFFMGMAGFMAINVWSTIYFAYHYQMAYREIHVNQLRLQVALREAEHRALSAQVNPHFLFNSLNTLRSLIEENPARAREAVTELARVFRASLQTSHQDLITLREELETVQAYLSLEQARFEERLQVDSEISGDALEAKLPPFLLQNLVENAVKYGLAPFQVRISYQASLEGDGLLLKVVNPGKIGPVKNSTGIGLENSRLRLRLLFGPRAFLKLYSPDESGLVIAEALIPQTRLIA